MRACDTLGNDVAIKAERGERTFATGDRIMFLKNEPSSSVKNGSLGTVQNVNQVRMAVLLDDGRNIAFDVKDYAHVDHGCAATIHNAQGVTIDRVQVLVTPGVDRHATYVALSRHRENVDIHYGKDDFASRAKLVRAASRERSKNRLILHSAVRPFCAQSLPFDALASIPKSRRSFILKGPRSQR